MLIVTFDPSDFPASIPPIIDVERCHFPPTRLVGRSPIGYADPIAIAPRTAQARHRAWGVPYEELRRGRMEETHDDHFRVATEH
jgi:hypothetical protein